MANNPYVNKVVVNNSTIINLTADTVDAAHLYEGYTAHDCSGAVITGTLVPGITPTGSITITVNGTTDVTNYASVVTNVPQAVPIDISTDAGMNAVLTAANVGKAYRFIGTTGTYINGDIYIVESV